MTLFDDYERTDQTPSPYAEDLFAFLNRSARPDVQEVRGVLESWFAVYPGEHQPEMRARFRDGRQHQSATWELYLHQVLTQLGFSVEIHPTLADTSTRPDFKVTGPSGAFLLEAATTEAGIDEPGRNDTREGWIVDALNAAPHPDFFVSLRFALVGQARPGNREIVRPVTAWLDGLDADAMLDGASLPEQDFDFRDWRIQLRAIPKSREFRGVHPDSLLVGMGPAHGGFVNDRERMLGKLRDKSGRYGHPGLPIVVAVNLLSTFGDEHAAEQALFGSLAVRFRPGALDSASTIRQQDGFWMRDGRPLSTRVSAVLEGPGITPWSFASRWPRLWLNPWAQHPLDVDVPFPRGIGDEAGRVTYDDATSTPGELLGPGPRTPAGAAV